MRPCPPHTLPLDPTGTLNAFLTAPTCADRDNSNRKGGDEPSTLANYNQLPTQGATHHAPFIPVGVDATLLEVVRYALLELWGGSVGDGHHVLRVIL